MEDAFDGLRQRLGDPASRFRRCFAHVDDVDPWQSGSPDPVGEDHAPVPSPVDIDQAFERWRRGGEYDWKRVEHPVDDRHVPRMIGNTLLLLESAFMLL